MRDYLVVTHVRSGSTMLADVLRCNNLGNPTEYLNPDAPSFEADWVDQYLATARAENPTSAPFGVKLMVHWIDHLRNERDRSDADTIARLMKPVRIVALQRRNVVAAAVSSVRAQLSGEWYVTRGSPESPSAPLPPWRILEPMITDNVAWIEWCHARLGRIVESFPGDALPLVYEDILADLSGSIENIAEFLDVAPPHPVFSHSGLVRQSDARSVELETQWRRASGDRGAAPGRI